MILDLSTIRQPDTDVTRRYQPADLASSTGSGASRAESHAAGHANPFEVVEPVDLKFTVHKDQARFRLTGTVSTVLELECSRCAEPYRLPIHSPFDLRYLPHSENVGPEREVEEDDLSDAFYLDDVIDLKQLMEEQFYLALPMKPLCRPDCKGLCPNCGTNLNVGTCDCQVRWEDPRLAPLKSLITRKQDDA
jgi:uncharacterized protein